MNKPYPHQEVGIKFLHDVKKGILGYDMGLGKTKIAIWAALGFDYILIICPTRLRDNWVDELNAEGETDIQVITTGKDRPRKGVKWIIVSYDLNKKMVMADAYDHIDCVIGDESHLIKGKDGKSAGGVPSRARAFLQAVEEVENVYLLTGTPIMNKPVELWNQLRAIDHKYCNYPKAAYSKRYCGGHLKQMGYRRFWWEDGASNLEELAEGISDKVTILKKRDVLDLPEKMRSKITIDMNPKERKEYKDAWNQYLMWCRDNPEITDEKLDKITNAQQLVEVIKLKQVTSRIKVNSVMEILEETGDQQIVIFCEFVETLRLLNETLQKNGVTWTTLKQNDLKGFQDGKYKVFTTNIIAGGTGLNMQNASICIFIDQNWTPGINEQAEARIERIGQKSTMNIYYLLAKNSIDEVVWERNLEKKDIINTIEKRNE